MTTHFLGQISVFPYNFAPFGWADCAGQLMPITQNAALFALLGTSFGGDGRTTFGLPNLQGRIPVSQGNAPGGSSYTVGAAGGAENVALVTNQIGAHNHTLNATTSRGAVQTAAGSLLATGAAGSGREVSTASIYNPQAPNTTLTTNSISPVGGQLPHNNIQPFLVLRYCIALQGEYPPRQ